MNLKEEERSRICREVSIKAGTDGKESACNAGHPGSTPNWEEFHRQKNLADCSPRSHKEVDMTEPTEHAAYTCLEPN